MKKFQFSLEILLKVRCDAEQKAQRELYAARHSLSDAWHLWKKIESDFMEQHALANRQGFSSVSTLRIHYSYLSLMYEKMQHQKRTLQSHLKTVRHCHKQLVVAMQQRKMVENLRKRQLHYWTKNEHAFERRLLDELATIRFGHFSPQGDQGN